MQLFIVLGYWAVCWILATILAIYQLTAFVVEMSILTEQTPAIQSKIKYNLSFSIVYVFARYLWPHCVCMEDMHAQVVKIVGTEEMEQIAATYLKGREYNYVFLRHFYNINAVLKNFVGSLVTFPTLGCMYNLVCANVNLFIWFVCAACCDVYALWNCQRQVLAVILGFCCALVVSFCIYCTTQLFCLRNIEQSMAAFGGVLCALVSQLGGLVYRLATKRAGYGTICYIATLCVMLFQLLQYLYKLEMYTGDYKVIKDIAAYGCGYIIKMQYDGCKRRSAGWDGNTFYTQDQRQFGDMVNNLSTVTKYVVNNDISVPEHALTNFKSTPNKGKDKCPRFDKRVNVPKVEVCNIVKTKPVNTDFSWWGEMISDISDTYHNTVEPEVMQSDLFGTIMQNIAMVFEHVEWPTASTVGDHLLDPIEAIAPVAMTAVEDMVSAFVVGVVHQYLGVNITLE